MSFNVIVVLLFGAAAVVLVALPYFANHVDSEFFAETEPVKIGGQPEVDSQPPGTGVES